MATNEEEETNMAIKKETKNTHLSLFWRLFAVAITIPPTVDYGIKGKYQFKVHRLRLTWANTEGLLLDDQKKVKEEKKVITTNISPS